MVNKKRTKTLYANISVKQGNFGLKFLPGKSSYNSADTAILRQLFSKEKARIIYTIKTKTPDSIYSLAKILKRDIKSLRQDLKLLERFGFVEFHSIKKGKRKLLKPVLVIDRLEIILNI